ncbi:ankyrin repeat domain-containing protein [Winogradskyella pulchriflava]|uniref:Ankyrin repeat domain-containing protein n=1 Tax=Winogradskyella pulchriflava TaxID=1110688 RepID=A0ABV6QB57_9FLAO
MKHYKSYLAVITLCICGLCFSQDNVFLKRDFWDTKPSVEVIKQKILEGNIPSEANSNNFDGVVYAILQNAPLESIVYMISLKGNDVNKLTHDGRTYIFWAAYKGNSALIEYLLENGAKTNLTDDKGNTIVTFAAGAGQKNPKVYDLIFDKDKDQISKTNPDGANALLLAAPTDEELKLVSYFQSKGLDINSKDNSGNGIFNYVARTGNTPLMNTLLAKDIKGTDQAFLFTAFGSRGHINTLSAYEYLESVDLNPNVANDEGVTPLHVVASINKDLEVLNYLLDKGLDVNSRDNDGNTAFINAASRNDLSVLKTLILKVKDINVSNNKGETALALAVKYNSAEVVEFLLSKKATTKLNDKDGNNIAYYLVSGFSLRDKEQFRKKAELLKGSGVNLTDVQRNGNTLYHMAVEKQSLELLEFALANKADINAKNKEGNTALHIAAMKAKDAKILEFLVAQGADKKATTDFEESAFDLALENELLKKNNISIDFLK